MEAIKASPPIPINPYTASQWINNDEAVLVDVREPFEHSVEHIESSKLHPLQSLDTDSIESQAGGRKVIFHCLSGKRSIEAAAHYLSTKADAYYLDGGIEEWKRTGQSTIRSTQTPRVDIMRQVQMAAGTLIILGVLLGLTINIWFIGLSAFVGCGLFFAGFTGWCGMARLLAKMPWNTVAPSCSISNH